MFASCLTVVFLILFMPSFTLHRHETSRCAYPIPEHCAAAAPRAERIINAAATTTGAESLIVVKWLRTPVSAPNNLEIRFLSIDRAVL